MKTSEEILGLIESNLRVVQSETEIPIIKRSDKLSLLGADSNDRTELIQMTLENLQIQEPKYQFDGASNLGELADMISSCYNKRSL